MKEVLWGYFYKPKITNKSTQVDRGIFKKVDLKKFSNGMFALGRIILKNRLYRMKDQSWLRYNRVDSQYPRQNPIQQKMLWQLYARMETRKSMLQY